MSPKTTVIRPQRDANLDLFRIISMLLIIFLHSIDHSGVLEAAPFSSPLIHFYVQFTYALTQVCVNAYVLLSGYYLINSKFRLQKLAALWMETAFYSFVLKGLFMVFGDTPFSILSLISCLFPILTGRYWFITIYVGLYLVSPFLNLAIRAMSKKQLTACNFLLCFLFSAWVSIHPAIAGMNTGGGWGLTWFVILYFVAAWFRLYYTPNQKLALPLIIFLMIPLAMGTLRFVAERQRIGLVYQVVENWYRYDSLPVYFMTISLFILFLNLQITESRISQWITRTAPLTLGVYLIHAHADVSPWLWKTLSMPEKMTTPLFLLLQISVVTVIFIVCIVLDFIRAHTIGKLESCHLIQNACTVVTRFALKVFSSD